MRRQDEKDVSFIKGYEVGGWVRFKAGYRVFKTDRGEKGGVGFANASGITSDWIVYRI